MNAIYGILKKKIEEKFGEKIIFSGQCEALQHAILDKTGERLSLVTLKRFLGFTSAKVEPRLSTLNILAKYCGYGNFELMKGDLMNSELISDFKKIERIETSDLELGSIIIIVYEPDRKIKFRYVGQNQFSVLESINSKLQPEDLVKIDSFNKGFELIASEVIRNGENLGSYISAKQGGIKSIEILLV